MTIDPYSVDPDADTKPIDVSDTDATMDAVTYAWTELLCEMLDMEAEGDDDDGDDEPYDDMQDHDVCKDCEGRKGWECPFRGWLRCEECLGTGLM